MFLNTLVRNSNGETKLAAIKGKTTKQGVTVRTVKVKGEDKNVAEASVAVRLSKYDATRIEKDLKVAEGTLGIKDKAANVFVRLQAWDKAADSLKSQYERAAENGTALVALGDLSVNEYDAKDGSKRKELRLNVRGQQASDKSVLLHTSVKNVSGEAHIATLVGTPTKNGVNERKVMVKNEERSIYEGSILVNISKYEANRIEKDLGLAEGALGVADKYGNIFVRVQGWDKTGEILKDQYDRALADGSMLDFLGDLTVNEYDGKDGTHHTNLQLNIRRQNKEYPTQPSAEPAAPTEEVEEVPEVLVDDDELPF